MLPKKDRTNPRAKAVMDKIKSKNDIIASQKITKGQTNMKLDKFLDSNGKMSEEALRGYAVNMPEVKFSNVKEFKSLFSETQGKFGIIKTPYKSLKVNMSYAYRHFYDNTYKTNRDNIKSAFFETFSDPLFIAKNDSKGRDSVYFYKPFLDKDKKVLNLFGIGIDKEGKVDFKTFYLDNSGARMREMERLADENIIYIKE